MTLNVSGNKRPKTVEINDDDGCDDDNFCIAIDFGTSNSRVGYFSNPDFHTIASIPSTVTFTQTQCLVGTDDTRSSSSSTSIVAKIVNIKRFLGRRSSDPIVRHCLALCSSSVELIEDAKGSLWFRVPYRGEHKKFSPVELTALIFIKLKELAETHLKRKVNQVVIAVPTAFDNIVRNEVAIAAGIADLSVLRLVDSSTLGVISHSWDNIQQRERLILAVDVGGSHLSVSLISVESNTYLVSAVMGDDCCGGEDFTNHLLDYCLIEVKRMTHKDIGVDNRQGLHRLRKACEEAKQTLSSIAEATINVAGLFEGDPLLNDFVYATTITRDLFNNLNIDNYRKCLHGIESVLKSARMLKSHVHEVILLGESSQIPRLRGMIKEFFDPNYPVTSHRYGLRDAVLNGASILVDLVSNIWDALLIDVIAQPLGIKVRGGIEGIVDNHAPLPAKKTKTFRTVVDHQTAVMITLIQGKYPMSEDRVIGDFLFEGVSSLSKGAAQIDVTVEVNLDNSITVSVKDRTTNRTLNQVNSVKSVLHFSTEIEVCS